MAKSATAIRLTDEGRHLLRSLSDRLGVSQTAVMEIAIRRFAEDEGARSERVHPPRASRGFASEEEATSVNRRRAALIQKRVAEGALSEDEEAELAELQARYREHVRATTTPLPWDALERLEARAASLRSGESHH